MNNKECIYYSISDTSPKTLVSGVIVKRYPTNFYINRLRIANTDSSEATVSVYAGRRYLDIDSPDIGARMGGYEVNKSLGDAKVFKEGSEGAGFPEVEEVNNYIIKDVKIPVGTSLILEKDDLYIRLGRNLKMTSSHNVDVYVELHNTKGDNRRSNSNNTY